MPTRIQIAKPDIVALFDNQEKRVYRLEELAEILSANQIGWRLTMSQSVSGFIDFLLTRTKLREVVLEGPSRIVRYTWGEATVYEIALSIGVKPYLSHGTAVFLHSLTEQLPRTIYVNHEQPPKPAATAALTQERINAALARPPRISKQAFKLGDLQVVTVNGKFTGRLEVGAITGPQNSKLDVTKIERTLIDITVRPFYAGGVYQVLETYKRARDQISTNLLAATFKRLDFVYPYHQCIGFYLERAGYNEKLVSLFAKMPIQFDFFLTHELKDPDYSRKWRLFFPRGM